MRFASFALVIAFLAPISAQADTAYVVRTAEGVFLSEFTPQRDACDEETKDKLFGLIAGQPVVTIGEAMTFTTMKADSTSKTFSAGKDAVGTWTFGSTILTVTIRHWGQGDHGPKVLEVEMSRVRRGRACREVWSGVVLPVRTRETLIGSTK